MKRPNVYVIGFALCATSILVVFVLSAPVTSTGFLSARQIALDEASGLTGKSISVNKVCVTLDECLADSCSGGALSCGLHWVRIPTEMSEYYDTKRCSNSSVNGCDCVYSDLFYTCSHTIAYCYWDPQLLQCMETVATGSTQASQSCRTVCDPFGGD